MMNHADASQTCHTFFDMFREGDDEGFAYFYKLYFNELYAYGISLGANNEMVKDLIQDIYFKVYFDRENINSQKHLKFYLLKALKNGIYDFSKKSKHTELLSHDDIHFTITTTILDEIIDEEERTTLQSTIDGLLANLTDRQKEAVYLRYIQEMEYEEIAEILNLTVHGTRKLVYRALEKAREANSEITLIFILFLIKQWVQNASRIVYIE